MTGQCDRGCDAGWTGIICNKGTEKIIKIKHQKKMNMKYQQIGFFKIEDFGNMSDAVLYVIQLACSFAISICWKKILNLIQW